MILKKAYPILDFILRETYSNIKKQTVSIIKLHPALKYYTLSHSTFSLKNKSWVPTLINARLYTKAFMLRIVNLTSKLTRYNSTQSRRKPIVLFELQSPFNHHTFNSYKSSFKNNAIPLVGNIPSYYLSDIKPIKNWKFSNIFLKSGDINSTHVKLRPRILKLKPSYFKQTICKKIRLRLMRSFLNKNLKTPMITKNILNLKSFTKRLAKFKPTLKRLTAPVYVAKWKTSYPLMFTNNIHINKTYKPQLDLTIKTFIQSRNNKRVRRFKKILFRKIKKTSRDRQATKSVLKSIRKQKYYVLANLSRSRLKNRRNSVVTTLINSILNTRHSKSFNKTYKLFKLHIKNYTQVVNLVSYKTQWNKHLAHFKNSMYLFNIKTLMSWKFKAYQSVKKPTDSLLSLQYKFVNCLHKSLKVHQSKTFTFKENSYPYIRPRTNKNFIFKNFGIFLSAFITLNQKNPFTYKYLFKKKIFSFLYPNEVRNALMTRKKRIVFYQLIYKLKHKSKQRAQHSFASFNKLFINQYKISLQNSSTASVTNKLFSSGAGYKTQRYSNADYITSRDEILYDQNFLYRGVDLSFKRFEVKIPRVKFKPGYQRMWRNARTALKESMGLKFIYQQQLTKRLVRFYKNSNKYSFARSEMSANRVIMYSRLLPDNPTVSLFVDQKLIYVNGSLLRAQQAILVPNDLLQLIVSLWYYVVYRWISNWTLKRHKKFKKLVYRKGLAGKHKVMKLKKQRSYYTPNWIYLARYDISDIKSFLEVDYFTLSSFVLYEPFVTTYYTPDETPDFRPNIYRMYNWKYIT